MVFEIITISVIHRLITKQDYLRNSLVFALIAWAMAFLIRTLFGTGKVFGLAILVLAVWVTGTFIERFKHPKILPITLWTLAVMGVIELIGVIIFVGLVSKLFGVGVAAFIEALSVVPVS